MCAFSVHRSQMLPNCTYKLYTVFVESGVKHNKPLTLNKTKKIEKNDLIFLSIS
jgi:hypothetical protein